MKPLFTPKQYDQLAEQLYELSSYCPKEYESALMEASDIINQLKGIEL
jgi:hypothetical protein